MIVRSHYNRTITCAGYGRHPFLNLNLNLNPTLRASRGGQRRSYVMNASDEPLMISVNQTCDMIGIKRTKLYDLVGKGLLIRVKVGRRTLITLESVKALIATS